MEKSELIEKNMSEVKDDQLRDDLLRVVSDPWRIVTFRRRLEELRMRMWHTHVWSGTPYAIAFSAIIVMRYGFSHYYAKVADIMYGAQVFCGVMMAVTTLVRILCGPDHGHYSPRSVNKNVSMESLEKHPADAGVYGNWERLHKEVDPDR